MTTCLLSEHQDLTLHGGAYRRVHNPAPYCCQREYKRLDWVCGVLHELTCTYIMLYPGYLLRVWSLPTACLTASCTCCIMHVLHHARAASCTCCIMHVLHHARAASCTCCIMHVLHVHVHVYVQGNAVVLGWCGRRDNTTQSVGIVILQLATHPISWSELYIYIHVP